MSELIIYDTKSQQKHLFRPIDPKRIGIYVCGITVYDDCHIGHARTFVAFDVIVRYLKYRYGKDNVIFVRNITDIDDKIIRRANENNEPFIQLAERFIASMNDDAKKLGLLSPDKSPRATEFIPQMQDLIAKLIANGHAYVAPNGDVYYRVRAHKTYGELSKRNLEEQELGCRVEINADKEDPLDFVLWKAAKPNEPQWPSPWGPGRPGWHLECSAMSMDILGETFDIHGGGFDLIFPHHENECAQSEACSGKEFVHTWMHTGFLQIKKEKMSKSLNNFITIKKLLEDASPEEVRYFMLLAHYRNPLEYSLSLVQQARQPLERLYTAMHSIKEKAEPAKNSKFETRFIDAMNDDFNTPEALAVLFDLARAINKTTDQKEAAGLAALLKELGGILGLLQNDPAVVLGEVNLNNLDLEIQSLINERNQARLDKNWAKADEIRNKLTSMGVGLEDTNAGAAIKRKN